MTKECDYGVIPPELSNCCGSNMIELNGKSYCLSCKEENYAKPTGTELHLPTTEWVENENNLEEHYPIPKSYNKIISEYVEKNDIKGLAEYFRAYIEDEVLETKEPMEWETKVSNDFDTYLAENAQVEAWTARINIKLTKQFISSQIKQAEERAYDRGYGQWIMK